MIEYLNVTRSEVSQIGLYVPFEEHLVLVVSLIITFVFMILFAIDAFALRKILDRYRLKYSFDRDIERKDITGKTETIKDKKLDRRQKSFEKRVLKD